MTFKYFFKYETGQCGTDGYDVIEYDEQPTIEELDQDAWEGAVDNASMFGIYPMSDAPEDYEDDDYEGDEYSDDISGSWEVYNEEKHDAYI